MSTSVLYAFLIFAFSIGFLSWAVLLRRKDGSIYDKIMAIASIVGAVATTVVGIATIKVMNYDVEREKLQNQPLFNVRTSLNYSSEKSIYDNEEFEIINEGKKTKEKAEIWQYSFLEVSYVNTNSRQTRITRCCPLQYYFGANVYTGNLDGTIMYSIYSGNNNELFANLYQETIAYGHEHPGIYVNVAKKHYFKIKFTDIYGDQHTIVKTKDSEIDPNRLTEIIKVAEVDARGKSFSVNELDLNEILHTCFPEQFEN